MGVETTPAFHVGLRTEHLLDPDYSADIVLFLV